MASTDSAAELMADSAAREVMDLDDRDPPMTDAELPAPRAEPFEAMEGPIPGDDHHL